MDMSRPGEYIDAASELVPQICERESLHALPTVPSLCVGRGHFFVSLEVKISWVLV
jgi:hypothetical protein